MKKLHNEKGFTLIEAVLAAAILAIGILGYSKMQIAAIRGNANGINITSKANWAADQVEKLLAMPYDDLAKEDTDSDGTNQDPLQNGIDKDGNNFGLNDVGGKADGRADSPDEDRNYTIFWNVAVDHPLPETITVNVIVNNKQDRSHPPVEFQYIKSRI